MLDTATSGATSALRHLEKSILSGDLRVGMQLPPERALAEELGVSRGAVREAIRHLQAQGIVESLPGHGRGTRITNGQSRALTSMFRLHLATANLSMDDLVATREALEGATAALAARHRDEEGLRRLKGYVAEMRSTSELEVFNDIDTQFHVAIASIADNPLIGHLTAAIREALRTPILDASHAIPRWQEFRLVLIEEHQGIFDAIAAQDSDRAAELMTTHIRAASRMLGLTRADAV